MYSFPQEDVMTDSANIKAVATGVHGMHYLLRLCSAIVSIFASAVASGSPDISIGSIDGEDFRTISREFNGRLFPLDASNGIVTEVGY
jgi:hypothetical protein